MNGLHTDPRAPDVHAVEAIADPTEKPADGSKLERVQWVLAFPLNLLMKVTIPGGRICSIGSTEEINCEYRVRQKFELAPAAKAEAGLAARTRDQSTYESNFC